ncbi:MAG TPA: cupin domain-containing protein [Puia sp.]|nr:cupin domain-containing protein [Puia sp.]
MSVNLYEGFSNPIAGETFRCLSSNDQSIVFEWLVAPGGYVPFEHVHLAQDEIFSVVSGELRIIIDGREHLAGAGETVIVPKGKRHIAFNNKPEPLLCTTEYRPGLETYPYFQCFGGLTMDGHLSENGSVSFAKMLYFLRKIKARCITRPTSIPAPLFRLATHLFYFIGVIAGWSALYWKYTSEPQRETILHTIE